MCKINDTKFDDKQISLPLENFGSNAGNFPPEEIRLDVQDLVLIPMLLRSFEDNMEFLFPPGFSATWRPSSRLGAS
jgi:hypothetical protein